MKITQQKDGNTLTIALEGRLDTTTSPELESALSTALDDVDSLIMDFGELAYLSSAGLRVLLSTQKRMNKQGSMTVKNVNETIMEVFDITGFTDILTIE